MAPMADPRLKIYEIFFSIQGESTFAGRPCVLVRLTGCQMRCSWCDTEYAFHGGAWMSLEEVLSKVAAFGCPLVEVTGGEPLLQPACLPLLTALCDAGYEVLLETGGGLDIAPVDARVRRILDIKCPASGESANNRWENLANLRSTDEVKFVVADRADYEWACGVIAERGLAGVCPLHFSPVWESCPPAELAAWILADRLPVRLTLQQHKILWGKDTRGV
ncbi:MAG: 7-carboxy-7-deazaguanine synthase [Acidobacteriota bacterium]|nr:7-carboxy-7-deazaguanine synthase [Acidobacteriota bacterium]